MDGELDVDGVLDGMELAGTAGAGVCWGTGLDVVGELDVDGVLDGMELAGTAGAGVGLGTGLGVVSGLLLAKVLALHTHGRRVCSLFVSHVRKAS
jgi:hypothetical protein